MKTKPKQFATFNKAGALTAGALLGLAMATGGYAQSADALIDKLVDKGILTVKEANDLREEADKNFSQAYSVKSGMPDWVTALKFNGDLRGRFEGFYGENDEFTDRTRFRYRMRFGMTAVLMNNFEIGMRLSSSEASGNFGGDPISGNTTFGDNGSKKFLYFDLAYAKWSLLNTPEWTGALTVGKMENPFVSPWTDTFDRDYTPEGVAGTLAYAINDQHSLKLASGGFVLDELSGSSHDPYMLGAQLRYDAKWSPKWSTTAGLAIFGISNVEQLPNGGVPNVNRGNTRDAAGAPVADFNPIYTDVGVTYTMEKFPYYRGAFPIGASADYIYNPAATSDNQGYSVGVNFGKAGKKGQWELVYRYAELRPDAWFEEFVESDFGAYYQSALPNSGLAAGYGAGTNVRGHVLRLAYSPYDSLTLSGTAFLTDAINENPVGSESGMARVQVDAMWKF